MVGTHFLSQACVFLSLLVLGPSFSEATSSSYQSTCQEIAAAISSDSALYYSTSTNYVDDIKHWVTSSAQNSTCSVEPSSAEDIGQILKIVAANQTPFGVKSGGHAYQQNFSSTPGVQIAMTRFSNITYSQSSQTVEVGAGLTWDQVYSYLQPYNVNVVGGRISGVGVPGFILGGGYSWKTNQYGLSLDNVQAYELVLPNGTVTTVTAADTDLFFGLKGGFNNFGIVTKFVLNTHPQTLVWGGSITIASDNIEELNVAVANYSANVTDPKAAIISTYNVAAGVFSVNLLVFYDAPTYPDGIFDQLLAVPSSARNISTWTFIDLVDSSPGLSGSIAGLRGVGMTVSTLEYPPALISAIVNETQFWGEKLSNSSALFISYDIEPFLPTIFSHGNDTAYPPDRSRALLPLNLFYAYNDSQYDDTMHSVIAQSAAYLKQVAISEGQDVQNAAIYGNYALANVPLEAVYGENVPRLQAIHEAIDPTNVMGLAGGFKF